MSNRSEKTPTTAERFVAAIQAGAEPMCFEPEWDATQTFFDDATCELRFPDGSFACQPDPDGGAAFEARALTEDERRKASGRPAA